VVALSVWVCGLTTASELLHNHTGLTERRDCPACRLERDIGTTTPAAAVAVSLPVLIPLGLAFVPTIAADLHSAPALQPSPRGPPPTAWPVEAS